MKTSYKKLLLFQGVCLLIFGLNSFVSNILGGYNLIVFLVLALILFKFIFGFERDRNRFTKDIIFEVIIFLLIYFIILYLSGVVIEFAKTANYYTWYGFKTFIIPLVLTTILKEILRYMMLKKSEGNKLLFFTTTILFIFLDITEAIYYNDFGSNYDSFIFIALTLLPAISTNVVFSYISPKTGCKPIILYALVTELYVYLMPIIPDLNEYLTAIVNFVVPMLLCYRVFNFFEKEKDDDIDRDYNKKQVGVLVVPTILTLIIVYFTSGYFKYYALAIASGSMEPTFSRGDVVIVNKVQGDYKRLKVGDILAHKHSGVIVVHRITKILFEDGEYYFYTKGDANQAVDNYVIEQEMVVGTVDFVIPYAGLPTVWLNE